MMERIAAMIFIVGTTWAMAAPITGVSAKATSSQVEKLFGPANLCNDAGLTDAKDGGKQLTTNVYLGGGSMWHSGYIALGADEHPIVEFDLGKQCTTERFHVWNHNANPSRGFKHVSIMLSDDGKAWRAHPQQFEFAKAPRKDDYTGEEHRFAPPVTARYIRFHCDATHRQGGNRELAGLGKVRFYEAAKPASLPKLPAQRFPAGSGVINVRLAPYHAKGDGTTDDTAALQKAIDDWQGSGRTIYLPAGTYMVCKPLRYTPAKGHGYNNLCGDGPTRTILKLRDDTFTTADKPLPVLTLGFNGMPDGKGVHADWFNNNVGEFQVDTGKGNPGAIGLQYYSNNAGALRNVNLRSGDGQGAIGLDLGYADQNGPCLVKNIDIDGFAVGVSTGATVNSQTAEFVTVRRCTKVGWENRGQCLAVRGLKVSGTGAGFTSAFGVVCLIDSEFSHTGNSDGAAITTHETLFARNITTRGYKTSIDNKRPKDNPTPNAVGPNVSEWVSTPPVTLFPIEQPRSLNLLIKETPTVEWGNPEEWVNVRSFRELSDPDDSAALQRAIDSGATTIYFPCGSSLYFGKPVVVRGNVQRIIGMFANVHGVKGDAQWQIGNDGPATVVLQDCRGPLTIDHAAPRTLVVQNGQGMGGTLTGGGEVFLDNVVADWDFHKGHAWARQFNNEREGTHITNSGATLWILGLKTERGGTLIETKTGGTTEVLGGLCYTTTKGKLAPMFVSTDAKVSYVLGEVCYSRDPYTRFVEQRRGKETKTLERGQVPLRPAFLGGGQIPLFVGQP